MGAEDNTMFRDQELMCVLYKHISTERAAGDFKCPWGDSQQVTN